MTMLVV